MKLSILFILVIMFAGCQAHCEDDICEEDDFMGFGTPSTKCGCCPWPCCCKCFDIGVPLPCYSVLDLTFIMDCSGSIGSSNWVTAKNFVAQVVSSLNSVGTNQRVAMVTYSTNATLEWNLKDPESDSAGALKSAIMSLQLKGRFTNTVEAMEVVVNQVFGSPHDDPKKPNVAVVVTDGRSNYRVSEVASMAQQLQAETVAVLAVGITSRVDQNELETITGDPDNVFMVPDFDQLKNIIEDLQREICPVSPTEEKCYCCCTTDQFFGGGGAYYYSDY